MSETNETRKVCPLCGTPRNDFAARAGLHKRWTCFHCRRTFWPPRNKENVLSILKTIIVGENGF
jgi:transposase-like protein